MIDPSTFFVYRGDTKTNGFFGNVDSLIDRSLIFTTEIVTEACSHCIARIERGMNALQK